MNNIWFISDTHFGHDKDFVWKVRGFSNVYEMNETIVERWNSFIKPNDIVYHLGDVMLGNTDENINYLRRLNGHIHVAIGNHDTNTRLLEYKKIQNVEAIEYVFIKKINNIPFYLSHYPTFTANFDDKYFSRHIINLYGHTHQKTTPFFDITNPFMYNVGVDAHECYPVHIDTIIQQMKELYSQIERIK